jgi:FtsZ-binding cell division protein ZapB
MQVKILYCSLTKEILKQNSDSTNYIAEIEDLKKKNAMLSQDVRAKTQKVVELEFRLDKMEKQLNEYSEENDKISLIHTFPSVYYIPPRFSYNQCTIYVLLLHT